MAPASDRAPRDVDVSVLPDAQGETIGFRDARIDHLSNSKELNFLLVPFLSHQLPQQMKINAADLMRQLLSRSAETTGYAFALTTLKIHSMLVQGSLLVLDVDAGMRSTDATVFPDFIVTCEQSLCAHSHPVAEPPEASFGGVNLPLVRYATPITAVNSG